MDDLDYIGYTQVLEIHKGLNKRDEPEECAVMDTHVSANVRLKHVSQGLHIFIHVGAVLWANGSLPASVLKNTFTTQQPQ